MKQHKPTIALVAGEASGDQLGAALIERLRHYFLTYKLKPDGEQSIHFDGTYGSEEAQRVIVAAMDDYAAHFAKLSS